MPNVLVEEKDRTTIVTLNRPERSNGLSVELMSELADTLDKSNADPQKRVLVLRGAGQAFCAGLDLQETTVVEKAHRSAEMVATTLLASSSLYRSAPVAATGSDYVNAIVRLRTTKSFRILFKACPMWMFPFA